MGCGAHRGDNKVIEVKRKTEAHDSHCVQPTKTRNNKITSVKKAVTRNVDEIAVTPSQFILEKNESITRNYTIVDKLGEGKKFLYA